MQSLDDGGRAQRLTIAQPVFRRRLFVFGAAFAMSAVAAYEMYLVLAVGGLTALEAVILGLFVILFAWIALSFASTLGGVIALSTRRHQAAGYRRRPRRCRRSRRAPRCCCRPTTRSRIACSRACRRSVSRSPRPARPTISTPSSSATRPTRIFSLPRRRLFLALRARLGRCAHLLPPSPQERRQESRQHRRMGAAFRRPLRADDRARRRLADDRRHAGAPRRRDGTQSGRRPDPDLSRDGQCRDAVRARAAVRRPPLRPADRLRACVVARRRRQLLGPQRGHPHARLRRMRRPAGA